MYHHRARLACWLALLIATPTPRASPRAGRRDSRGDVPGWVLITVMSVGLVALIGAVAGDELIRLLRAALRSVN